MIPGLNLQPLRLGTPLEDHLDEAGLLVKREDLSCGPPGPPFSKTRGVFAHVKARYDEGVRLFGALDTSHSQAGHAVAYAARLVGADCVNYFPVYKADRQDAVAPLPDEKAGVEYVQLGNQWMRTRPPQQRSAELGASLVGLPAGRSAVLYHTAKRDCEARGGYMMPNALRLPETIEETAAEVVRTFEHASREQFMLLRELPWLISVSSATIASGVLRGLADVLPVPPHVILHMGYSRSHEQINKYVGEKHGRGGHGLSWSLVDEGYEYKDKSRRIIDAPFPANHFYDMKALNWWIQEGRAQHGRAVFWLIG